MAGVVSEAEWAAVPAKGASGGVFQVFQDKEFCCTVIQY
jgi:hypothetical protein